MSDDEKTILKDPHGRDFILPEEAIERASARKYRRREETLNVINERIRSASWQGHYSASIKIEGKDTSFMVRNFESLGYVVVTEKCGLGETIMTISWRAKI